MNDKPDQILLWDTGPEGKVDLSKSAKQLNQKIKITHLIGGHVIVRPAELFEGGSFFVDAALDDSGLLYQMMKAGQASLALSKDQTLKDRLEWRFRHPGKVYDRGVEVTDPKRIATIRRRCENRLEALERRGWDKVAREDETPHADSRADLRYLFQSSLLLVGSKYFSQTELLDSPLAQFESCVGKVESRSDLYPHIDGSWSKLIRVSDRIRFIIECKERLTADSALETSWRYGGRVSELHPTTFSSYGIGQIYRPGLKFRPMNVEIEITKMLLSVLPEMMTAAEQKRGSVFAKEVLTLDNPRFVACVAETITGEHRRQLGDLLYEKVTFLEGKSLVEHLAAVEPSKMQSELRRCVKARVEEMDDKEERAKQRVHNLISFATAIGGLSVLLMVRAGWSAHLGYAVLEKMIDASIRTRVKAAKCFAGLREIRRA